MNDAASNQAPSDSSKAPGSVPAALKLQPISPESFQRYARRRTLERKYTDYPVKPLSRSFSRNQPPEWKGHRHPEGCLYFLHEKHRVFTDCYLYDNVLLAQINSALSQLLELPSIKALLEAESNQIDIVLDLLAERPDNTQCGYYLVDHSERTVFWAEEFEMNTLEIWDFVPGIETASHVQMGLEIQYWLHCEYFPISVSFSPDMLLELRDTIIYSIGDTMSSTSTTLRFSVEQLSRRLSLTRDMMDDLRLPSNASSRVKMNQGSIAIFARFMKEFARERFYDFHGEKTSRLNNTDSVYGYKPERSYFLRMISPFLLNAPIHHLRAIEDSNTDQLINFASWHKLLRELREEWQDLVLYGTLILNTNMAFLAIPPTLESFGAQLASYTSICFSFGSVIISIVLLRKYHSTTPDVPDVDTAAAFFQRHGTTHGLEPLSIILSLPSALMVWGMVTFALAFLITVFQIGRVEVRGVMGAAVVAVFLALVGYVWTERHLSWSQRVSDFWVDVRLLGLRLFGRGVRGEGESKFRV
ncbi:hypothetical protein R3P38DRAFT_2923878 [Favolaschia claudopus]|uniref:Uncharacterized protein n=1 Tax=Favolaschia claudopus TaxID=2862362 RepID=A0AAW0BX63_9AGAR